MSCSFFLKVSSICYEPYLSWHAFFCVMLILLIYYLFRYFCVEVCNFTSMLLDWMYVNHSFMVVSTVVSCVLTVVLLCLRDNVQKYFYLFASINNIMQLLLMYIVYLHHCQEHISVNQWLRYYCTQLQAYLACSYVSVIQRSVYCYIWGTWEPANNIYILDSPYNDIQVDVFSMGGALMYVLACTCAWYLQLFSGLLGFMLPTSRGSYESWHIKHTLMLFNKIFNEHRHRFLSVDVTDNFLLLSDYVYYGRCWFSYTFFISTLFFCLVSPLGYLVTELLL